MYLTILRLPLLGSITAGFIGRKIGVTGSQMISCLCVMCSALLSIIAFYEVGLRGSPVSIHLTSWIDSELLQVDWGFLFDSLTTSILLPVLVVSALVHLFSIRYMGRDPHVQRFFSYLSIFTFFILILVRGDNYLVLFVGWEGIGISSYLLINFWYTRLQANKSRIKRLRTNRVGDTFLSIGFFALFFIVANIDFATVFSLSPFCNEVALTCISLLFLLGRIGKSAQLGLHTWLPDRMEGPTPVSALIHAATLVTAGVYLLLRSSPLLEYAPTALVRITWVGAVTAFIAATTGLLQNDLKRVIAYSTCSQIGYLFIAVGLSQYNVALFHLVNHAFFKALLFLARGGVLHSIRDQQDIRRLGGLVALLPFTYVAILIGSLSLIAIPFITGFYSKDLILELRCGQYNFTGYLAYTLGTITAGITAFYSFRLITITFFSTRNARKTDYENTIEQPFRVRISYTILRLRAIFFGFVWRDAFTGIGSTFLSSALFTHPDHVSLVEAEYGLTWFHKILPAILTLMGIILRFYLYNSINGRKWLRSITPGFSYLDTHLLNFSNQNRILQKDTSLNLTFSPKKRLDQLYRFLNGKWYFDVVYNHFIYQKRLNLGLITSKIIDLGVVELLGPFGISSSLTRTSNKVRQFDTGVITTYGLYIVIGILTISILLFSNILLHFTFFSNTLFFDSSRILFIYAVRLFYISSALPFKENQAGETVL